MTSSVEVRHISLFTGCSIYFLPISNGYISEPFHISTYVVKTKIGLRSGSFIWQIFNFQKNKKKVKVSTKVLIFQLSVLGLEPGTFSISDQSLSMRPREQVGKLCHILTIYFSNTKILQNCNFCQTKLPLLKPILVFTTQVEI